MALAWVPGGQGLVVLVAVQLKHAPACFLPVYLHLNLWPLNLICFPDSPFKSPLPLTLPCDLRMRWPSQVIKPEVHFRFSEESSHFHQEHVATIDYSAPSPSGLLVSWSIRSFEKQGTKIQFLKVNWSQSEQDHSMRFLSCSCEWSCIKWLWK